MDSFSYSSSSSSSSTYLSLNPQENKPKKPATSIRSSVLHSVRKLPAKPWKKPIAPLPPTPPRVYKVDSVNFREVVQKLTSAPEFQSRRRLRSVAPPPLNLSASTTTFSDSTTAPVLQLLPNSPNRTPLSATLMTETVVDTKPRKQFSDSFAAAIMSPLGFSLSPSSHAWWSFPLLSPGTLSSLEQSTVL